MQSSCKLTQCTARYSPHPLVVRGAGSSGPHRSPSFKLPRCCKKGSTRLSGNRPPLQATAVADEASNPASSLISGYSELVNREVVLFLFQLEFDTQLQRALTNENYETAKDVRERRRRIDEHLIKLQEDKGLGCGARDAANAYVTDFAAEGLRVRTELQRAVEEERYSDAARLRDELKTVQEDSQAAQAAAEHLRDRTRRFHLGQRVLYHGCRAVVCGWDIRCCESEAWQQQAGVTQLARGVDQPFYHLMVDVRDWQGTSEHVPIAYAAEELLVDAKESGQWSAETGEAAFKHPYSYLVFLGRDARGNMLPTRKLREKYCAPRHDVHPEGEGEESLSSDEPQA